MFKVCLCEDGHQGVCSLCTAIYKIAVGAENDKHHTGATINCGI